MYTVEALIPDLEGLTVLAEQWQPVYLVPQGYSEQAELMTAWLEAGNAEKYYVQVRITKSTLNGGRQVVR